jgi:dephospho-CoA kinase
MTLMGITGAYCAGKNFVAALLEKRGLPVLDVDRLGHRALEQEQAAVIALFGRAILGDDGRINRRLLGEQVFGDGRKLAALEAVVHPVANALTEAWLADQRAQGKRAAVINAALLHRSSVFERLDLILLVRAPVLTRFIRARARDRLPLADLAKRFKSQSVFLTQYSSSNADKREVRVFTINNRRSKRNTEYVENSIDRIMSFIRL